MLLSSSPFSSVVCSTVKATPTGLGDVLQRIQSDPLGSCRRKSLLTRLRVDVTKKTIRVKNESGFRQTRLCVNHALVVLGRDGVRVGVWGGGWCVGCVWGVCEVCVCEMCVCVSVCVCVTEVWCAQGGVVWCGVVWSGRCGVLREVWCGVLREVWSGRGGVVWSAEGGARWCVGSGA